MITAAAYQYLGDRDLCRRALSRGASRRGNRLTWSLE